MNVKDTDLKSLATAARSAASSIDELSTALSQIKGTTWAWLDSAGNAHSVRSRKRIERILKRKEQHRKESK